MIALIIFIAALAGILIVKQIRHEQDVKNTMHCRQMAEQTIRDEDKFNEEFPIGTLVIIQYMIGSRLGTIQSAGKVGLMLNGNPLVRALVQFDDDKTYQMTWTKLIYKR